MYKPNPDIVRPPPTTVMEDSPILMLRSLQRSFRSSLQQFANSDSTFQVVNSIPQTRSPSPTKTLYVFDSSFNPPSKAHALIARNAIQRDGSRPARLLLLLATENADKKPKPAAFEDRLTMMTILASELYESMGSSSPSIDVGITKKPFFVDKARSIEDSGIYDDAEQVHLTGFDTIVRIFDSKYYPQDQKLRVLEPFLSKHRLRVTYRLGDKFGTKADQDGYVETIADGSREDEGMKKEWRAKIDMVNDAKDGEGVSSTEARKAIEDGRYDDLDKYVGSEVSRYVREMKLYREL